MRLIRVLGLVAVSIAVATSGARACSQCTCGAPFPTEVLGGAVPSTWSYGIEDRYLSKENALDEEPGVEEENEHHVSGYALWRPLDRIALLARVPWVFKQITSRPAGSAEELERTHGLGDAEVTAMLGLFDAGRTSVGLLAGLRAPTGSNDRRNALGDRLDAHLQPGIGAWTGSGGLQLEVASVPGTWSASLLGRASGTSAHGYRYGSVALYNLGFTSMPHGGVSLIAQVNGRSAGSDRLEDGSRGVNTGGTVIYLAPGALWDSGFGLGVEGAVQVPVAQALDGDQTEHVTARISFFLSR